MTGPFPPRQREWSSRVELKQGLRLSTRRHFLQDFSDSTAEADRDGDGSSEASRVPVHLREDHDLLCYPLNRGIAVVVGNLERSRHMPVRIRLQGGDVAGRIEVPKITKLEERPSERWILPDTD